MSADVARVLRRAAANLEEFGWCQGTMFTTEGQRCTLGAFHSTKADPKFMWGAQQAFAYHLGVRNLVEWNDEPGRTQQDVVKAMLETADVEDFR